LLYVWIGVAHLLPCAIWILLRPQPFRVIPSELGTDWRESWAYSRWLVVARTLGIASHTLIPWFIAVQFGKIAAGQFGTCLAPVGLTMMFMTGVNNFLQPQSVRAYQVDGLTGLQKSLGQSAAVFLVSLGPVTILLFVLGDRLLDWIYKIDFPHAGLVVFLLSLNLLLVSMTVVAGNGMAALKRSTGFIWGEAAYCIASLGSAIVLISKWGMIGAALALVIGGVVGVLVMTVTLWRFLAESVHNSTDALSLTGEGL